MVLIWGLKLSQRSLLGDARYLQRIAVCAKTKSSYPAKKADVYYTRVCVSSIPGFQMFDIIEVTIM